MSDSTSTPTSSIERAGMLDAVRARLAVLSHRYLEAYTRIEDAHTRRDGILPTDCVAPDWPAPVRIQEDTLRDMGVWDLYTRRKWTTDLFWPDRFPAVRDSALRALDPTETLELLEHLEETVEAAESAAEAYIGVCLVAERVHYAEHQTALRKLASVLDVRLVATPGPSASQ